VLPCCVPAGGMGAAWARPGRAVVWELRAAGAAGGAAPWCAASSSTGR
jgi:hypothetical protein